MRTMRKRREAMNSDKCKYSYHEIKISSVTFANYTEYPVECPECGAIRKLELQPRSVAEFMLPEHNTLMGTSRTRKHWKLENGRWRIVD